MAAMKSWFNEFQHGNEFVVDDSNLTRIIAATEAHFADLQKTYVTDSLKKLEHSWVKCIELKGDYVKKQITIFLKFSFFLCKRVLI